MGSTDTKFTKPSTTDATTTDGFRVGRRVRWEGMDLEGEIIGTSTTREYLWSIRWDDGRKGEHAALHLVLLPEPDAPATPEPAPAHDPVSHPVHYTSHPSGIECIEVTRHMGFNLGNAVKYIWRADLKGNSIEDLRKAAWYIDDEIQKRQNSTTSPTTQSLH